MGLPHPDDYCTGHRHDQETEMDKLSFREVDIDIWNSIRYTFITVSGARVWRN